MTTYNISQAANLIGVQRQTLHRHIKKKGISTTKNDQGHTLIDASELVRVYPDRFKVGDTGDVISNDTKLRDETPKSDTVDNELLLENTRLQAELKGKDREIELLEKQVHLLEAPKATEKRTVKLLGIVPIAW
ncbi:MAG: hypothetical protein AAFX97_03315 [Pseudomonadota bacterium]